MRALAAMMLIAAIGCTSTDIERVKDLIDAIPEKPADKPQEPPQVEPEPEQPEPVNHGGIGLYKPESSLWLLPRGIRAATIKTAGEYKPDGSLVKWFRMGDVPADGKQSLRDDPAMYHPQHQDLGGVKMRNAKATANGNIFRAVLRDGRKLEKVIIDRNVRQE